MLKLLITKQDVTNIVLSIFIITFYIIGYDTSMVNENFGVFDLFFDTFKENYPIGQRILAGVILMLQVLLINILFKKTHYFKKDNLIVGLCYIYLNTLSRSFLVLTPALFVNSFLLFALFQSSNLYNVRSNISAIINIGLMIGFSLLFEPQIYMFIFFGLLVLNIYRPFKANEYLALILSACVPIYVVAAYFFYYDIPFDLSNYLFSKISFFNFKLSIDYYAWVLLGSYGVLILWGTLSPLGVFFRKVIEAEKYRQVVFWFLISGLLFSIFSTHNSFDFLRILSLPLSVVLSMKILSIKSNYGEIINILLITMVVVLLWQPW